MATEYKWVIAYDKETGERRDFVCCPKNNALFYEEKFRMEGYDVRVMSDDEVDELIEREKAAKAKA